MGPLWSRGWQAQAEWGLPLKEPREATIITGSADPAQPVRDQALEVPASVSPGSLTAARRV